MQYRVAQGKVISGWTEPFLVLGFNQRVGKLKLRGFNVFPHQCHWYLCCWLVCAPIEC